MKPLHAWLLMLVACLAGLLPVIGRGHVFFAHGNELELGLPAEPQGELANRRLSDQSAAFAPELALHLSAEHDSWTALWNPHVQLGRPAHHTGGMSRAFWPTHVLSWFHSDPLVVMSALVCLTLLLAAAFAFGMAHELGARPLACAAIGVGFALSPFAGYWSSFPIFLNGPCWTMGLLWSAARFLRRGDAVSALAVVICSHTLIVGAYPQAVVWSLQLALPLMLLWGWRAGWGASLRLAGLGLLGVLSTLPLLLDLLLAAQRSARLEAELGFFTQVLPRPQSLAEWAAVAGAWVDNALQGNPLRDARPASFVWSAALTPLFACLALWALRRRMQPEAWILIGSVALILLASLVPGVYRFGWEHLGWSLSRFVPLGALLVPGFLLAALGARHLQSGDCPWWLALPPLFCLSLSAALTGFTPAGLMVSLCGVGWAIACARTGSERLLFAGAALGGLWYCGLHCLHRPAAAVARHSPLVDAVRDVTSDGTRMAWIADEPPRILPPNQESWLGLRSVHSYDSLSSRAYQEWCAAVSSEAARNYGRKFDHIQDLAGLRTEAFRNARVGLVLSTQDLRALGWRRLGSLGAIGLWKPADTLPFARIEGAPSAGSVRAESSAPERITLIVNAPEEELLIVLSQQEHPQWIAKSAGRELATGIHQGLWQTVRAPKGRSVIELEFRPWMRWMWVPQLLLALASLWLLARSRLLRQPRAPRLVEGQR